MAAEAPALWTCRSLLTRLGLAGPGQRLLGTRRAVALPALPFLGGCGAGQGLPGALAARPGAGAVPLPEPGLSPRGVPAPAAGRSRRAAGASDSHLPFPGDGSGRAAVLLHRTGAGSSDAKCAARVLRQELRVGAFPSVP